MKKIVLALTIIAIFSTSCIRKYGCTATNAFNYDPSANEDNGLCEYSTDAFGGIYDGTESIYRISANGDTLITRSDSFIIFIADTNRIQLKGFYECQSEQDSIGCVVVKYDAYLSGSNSCATGWQGFKLTRDGASTVNYHYKKIYTPTDRDSIVGQATKR